MLVATHCGKGRLHRITSGKLLNKETNKQKSNKNKHLQKGKNRSQVAKMYYLKCPVLNKVFRFSTTKKL